jgi:hypothetical protein
MKKWLLISLVTLGIAIPSIASASSGEEGETGCPCPWCP